ncbi:MAG: hypothetical protein RL338_1813 [Chloroflexota bacterium]
MGRNGRAATAAIGIDRREGAARRALVALTIASLIAGLGAVVPATRSTALAADGDPLAVAATSIATQVTRDADDVDLTSGVPAITTGDTVTDVATVTGAESDGAGGFIDPTSGSVDFYFCHDPRTAPTDCSSASGWIPAGNATMDGGTSSTDGIATATLATWTPPNGGGWYLISARYDGSGGTYDPIETTGDTVGGLVHVLYDSTTVTTVDPTTGGYGATYDESVQVTGSATDGSGGVIDPTGTVRVYYCYDLNVAPTSCSAASGYPIATLSLTEGTTAADGIGEATLVDWLPPLAGYYKLHAVYRGDDVYAPSVDDGTNEDVFAAYSTVTYTGQTYDAVTDGTTVLAARVDGPSACVIGSEVRFVLVDAAGTTIVDVTAGVAGGVATTTQTVAAGVYEVIVSATSGDALLCDGGADVAVLTVVEPGGVTNGGGWYKPERSGGSQWSGSPRVNFGYSVTKTVRTKAGVTTTTYRGQLLWLNKGQFRIKGTIFSQTTGTTGAYGTFTCPAAFLATLPAGATGTRCGSFTGEGVLQQWSDELGWVSPGILPSAITFTGVAYDAGQLKSCKGKGKLATCSLTEVPGDWFGIQVNEVPNTALRESAPTKLSGGSLRVL